MRPDDPSSDASPTPGTSGVMVRALAEHAEFRACVALQRATWGPEYDDVVPASLLKVTARVGGVVMGAFGEDGSMVGFVYGLTGVRRDETVHWSHMLAVLPAHRGRGIGRLLKEEQRKAVRAMGVDSILWTFDPLVARNAHFNLNRLGARVDGYVEEMYGDTGSALHAFGTDRFVVRWSSRETVPAEGSPPVDPLTSDAAREAPVLVHIPRDIEAIASADPSRALEWRARTRAEFTARLASGYQVVGFHDPGPPGEPAYLLRRL